MALFSSVFRQLFERFAHFVRRRETQMVQQCAAQELAAIEKLPEAFDFTDKRRKKCHQHRKKEEERQAKKEREMNEAGSYKDKAEKERETLSLEKIYVRGHVQQKKRDSAEFRDMQSLGNFMKGESEHREAGEKKRKKRKLKERETTEPAPLLVEVKPQKTPVSPPVRSSFLKPIEAELPSVSEHFALPAAHFKPLPPVTKRPMRPQKPDPASEEVTLPGTPLQVDPPKPMVVSSHPTPAPDELFSLRCSQVSSPKRLLVPQSSTSGPDEAVALKRSSTQVSPLSLVKPQLSTSSLFEPLPHLMLIDIEDEENEYVEYTGKTIQVCDLPKSEINPRMAAWVESDSEVLEEVQGFEEDRDDANEMGDSKAIQGHLDEASPKNKTQHHVNVQEEPQRRRKVPLFLFTWAEEMAKKKEEKKIRKEKEQRDKELLFARYRSDPKLKHLLINKHNRHYRSSE